MNRRKFLQSSALLAAVGALPISLLADHGAIKPIRYSQQQWRERLSAEQFKILRKEGTEAPFSSSLNNENRPGHYHCAACDLPLFNSQAKYDSGTGWPSFYTSITDHLETKPDRSLFFSRTEYHCARCGGHQGHVFDDGPKPTGLRWCNNGVALTFVPAS